MRRFLGRLLAVIGRLHPTSTLAASNRLPDPPAPYGPLQRQSQAWGDHAERLLQAGADPELVVQAQERCQALLAVMVHRTLSADQAEREGREDEAIALYEANVKDEYFGVRPYARLLTLYARRGRRGDESRIAALCLSHVTAGMDDDLRKTCRRLTGQASHGLDRQHS